MSIVIRPAVARDARAIAEVYVDGWRSAYAGLLPDALLLRLDAEERQQCWWRQILARRRRDHMVYVADDPKHGVVGFTSGGPTRDRRLDYGGELYTLYVRDEFQGTGIGKRLFATLSERLLAGTGPSVVVWVLKGNPARFFYEALGGRYVAERDGRMGGAKIVEIAFGWEDIRALIALGKSGQSD